MGVSEFVTKADCLAPDALQALGRTKFLPDSPERDRACDCGFRLDTELDFASHFVLADARYLNLGECPNSDKGRAIISRGTRNIPSYTVGGPVQAQKGAAA